MSEHARGRIVERLGVDTDRIVVAGHGIDTLRFGVERNVDDERFDAEFGRQLPERFVCYPAALWPHKNHEGVITALSNVAARDLGLVLTGPTYGALPRLLDHAAAVGMRDRVHHLGFLPANLVPALYRRATALVFPTLYEGFGLPAIEAMACGCPVAAARSGPLPEICGDAALMFDPTDLDDMCDAIDRVVGDQTLRLRLVRAGKKKAGGFTWEAVAAQHVRAYEQAVRLSS